jgi:hypothetical protein
VNRPACRCAATAAEPVENDLWTTLPSIKFFNEAFFRQVGRPAAARGERKRPSGRSFLCADRGRHERYLIDGKQRMAVIFWHFDPG